MNKIRESNMNISPMAQYMKVIQLAQYKDKRGYLHRGCVSKNIAQKGETLIKGVRILDPLKDPNRPAQKVRNSLANHKQALQIYKETQERLTRREVVLDPNIETDLLTKDEIKKACEIIIEAKADFPNIETDLLINAYMCYRVSNSDNHSSNIIYVQKTLPDGRILVSVAPMIDNGNAWEMSNGQCLIMYRSIIEKNTKIIFSI